MTREELMDGHSKGLVQINEADFLRLRLTHRSVILKQQGDFHGNHHRTDLLQVRCLAGQISLDL